MFDNIFLPDSGPGGWTPEYLAIIREAADQIIVNPAKTYTQGRGLLQAMTEAERDRSDAILAPYWQMVRKAERGNMALRTPQAYLNEKIMRRRYGWLQRWVNEWVLWQREAIA